MFVRLRLICDIRASRDVRHSYGAPLSSAMPLELASSSKRQTDMRASLVLLRLARTGADHSPIKSSAGERAEEAGMSWRYGALLLAAVLVASCGGRGQAAWGTVHGTFEQ